MASIPCFRFAWARPNWTKWVLDNTNDPPVLETNNVLFLDEAGIAAITDTSHLLVTDVDADDVPVMNGVTHPDYTIGIPCTLAAALPPSEPARP